MDRAEFWTELTQDLGYALRMMRRTPAFTAAALADAGARHRRQQRHLQRRQRRAAAVAAVPRRGSPAPAADAVSRRHQVRVAVGARLHERAGRPAGVRPGRGDRHAPVDDARRRRAARDRRRLRQRRTVRHARAHGDERARLPSRRRISPGRAMSRCSVMASGSACSAATPPCSDARSPPRASPTRSSASPRPSRRFPSRPTRTFRWSSPTSTTPTRSRAGAASSCPCSRARRPASTAAAIDGDLKRHGHAAAKDVSSNRTTG